VELTIIQAAQALDCSVDTVRRHIRRGKLSARKDEHGRYLIQFGDTSTSIKKDSSYEQATTLEWLKPSGAEPVWPEASAGQEGSDSKDRTVAQRRHGDSGLDKSMAQLLEERQAMIEELQMWRTEARAAQVALEELRRLMPSAVEPKRTRGWWRLRR
jgi:excisionase family DNA binding protein